MCMTKETFKNSNVVSKKKKKKNPTTLQHWNFDTTLQCCNVVMLYNVVFSPTGKQGNSSKKSAIYNQEPFQIKSGL